ncbi:unnamed protein product [Tetraodon nigroviridis]|uniref:(spotted green pufferfish) hypothetical protein n=1 Tax=Tetraodon nigroviridis TaxID=99883 RepID=Q4THY0_TETNG|nr:unnamed protein product [Tetraodon nigroviridis]
MDLLAGGYLDARSPYDYTFNFWNDYLGLSTLVAKSKISGPSCSPNSITESLKATLGLEDESPDCSCLLGPPECCAPRRAPSTPPGAHRPPPACGHLGGGESPSTGALWPASTCCPRTGGESSPRGANRSPGCASSVGITARRRKFTAPTS